MFALLISGSFTITYGLAILVALGIILAYVALWALISLRKGKRPCFGFVAPPPKSPAQLKKEKLERERLEQEKQEQERLEQERLEQEQASSEDDEDEDNAGHCPDYRGHLIFLGSVILVAIVTFGVLEYLQHSQG